jgi:peroxiredoxin
LLSEDEKKDVQILAVSADTHEESKQMLDYIGGKEYPGKADFPLLQDVDHKVVDAYGLYNPVEETIKPGIPYPTVYVINKEGVVTKRFQDLQGGVRATDEEIREELKRIGAAK